MGAGTGTPRCMAVLDLRMRMVHRSLASRRWWMSLRIPGRLCTMPMRRRSGNGCVKHGRIRPGHEPERPHQQLEDGDLDRWDLPIQPTVACVPLQHGLASSHVKCRWRTRRDHCHSINNAAVGVVGGSCRPWFDLIPSLQLHRRSNSCVERAPPRRSVRCDSTPRAERSSTSTHQPCDT